MGEEILASTRSGEARKRSVRNRDEPTEARHGKISREKEAELALKSTCFTPGACALLVTLFVLTLAAVLVNPHLFVYDLLVLAPALLLLANLALASAQPTASAALKALVYLAFVLPLFGPLSQWTHLQLSVPAFTALLWLLWRQSATPSHKLAPSESSVV